MLVGLVTGIYWLSQLMSYDQLDKTPAQPHSYYNTPSLTSLRSTVQPLSIHAALWLTSGEYNS